MIRAWMVGLAWWGQLVILLGVVGWFDWLGWLGVLVGGLI
jgi:hypothetical protein